MRRFCLFLLVLVCSAVLAQEKPKLAVMDLKARTGVNEMTASMLTDILCAEINELGEYKVISRDDIRAMLIHVKDQQLLGCDDTKCLAEIGGALGVPLLLYGNVGMLGGVYLVNLKLIDIDNADVVNRVSKEYTGDESGLMDLVRNSVHILFGKEDLADAGKSVVEPVAPIPGLTEWESLEMSKGEWKKYKKSGLTAPMWKRYRNYDRNVLLGTALSAAFPGAGHYYNRKFITGALYTISTLSSIAWVLVYGQEWEMHANGYKGGQKVEWRKVVDHKDKLLTNAEIEQKMLNELGWTSVTGYGKGGGPNFLDPVFLTWVITAHLADIVHTGITTSRYNKKLIKRYKVSIRLDVFRGKAGLALNYDF